MTIFDYLQQIRDYRLNIVQLKQLNVDRIKRLLDANVGQTQDMEDAMTVLIEAKIALAQAEIELQRETGLKP